MEEDKNEVIKKTLIEQLEKIPIIQVCCEKLNVPRSNFYRWKQEDLDFAKTVNEATSKGKNLVNDLAESQLINLIKDGNLGGICFWLKANKKEVYGNKVELSTITEPKEELTPEQAKIVRGALNFVSPELITEKKYDESKRSQTTKTD